MKATRFTSKQEDCTVEIDGEHHGSHSSHVVYSETTPDDKAGFDKGESIEISNSDYADVQSGNRAYF